METATLEAPHPTANAGPLARLERWLTSAPALAALVVLGAAARFYNYAANRSLWVDEAAIAHNILHRSFGALAGSLDYAQVAPLGFLWLERAAVLLLGPSEYALRLVPLLASLAALALFAALARRVLPGPAAPFALALFAAASPLLYYSAEVKQYALDSLVAVAIPLLALAPRSRIEAGQPLAHRARLALAGALAPWLSQPAVFVLAGTGWYLLLPIARRRRWVHGASLAELAPVLAAWAVSALAATWHSLHSVTPAIRAHLDAFWAPAFLPVSRGPAAALHWLGAFAVEEARWLFWTHLWPLVLLLLALGFPGLLRRRDGLAAWLVLPLGLALVASALHLYPLATRLTLVFIPALLLGAGAAVQWLADAPRRPLARAAVLGTSGLLAADVLIGLRNLPFVREELRPVVQYLATHRRPDDPIYVYYGGLHAFRYYAERAGIPPAAYRVIACRRGAWTRYLTALDSLRGSPRLWLVLSHAFNKAGVREDSLVLGYLARIGRRLDDFTAPGATVQLFDLSDSTRAAAARAFVIPASGDTSATNQRCFSQDVLNEMR
jgi:hypothetical protein